MFTVIKTACGYDLFDDHERMVDTAPSLDWLRGYIEGLLDGGRGYRCLTLGDAQEAIDEIDAHAKRAV